MRSWQEVKAERHAKVSHAERAIFDEAYEKVGIAMRAAELFYDARTGAGLTQTELAKRMRTTQPTIAEIEGGGRIPTLEMLERLAAAVGLRLDVRLIA